MGRNRRWRLVVGMLGLGCSHSPGEQAPPERGEKTIVAEPASPSPAPGPCASPSAPERLELGPKEAITIASGLTVAFEGTSTDHYDDGSFDVLGTFGFSWGSVTEQAMVSVLAKDDPFREQLGHCWRITQSKEADGRTVLEIAPSAALTESPPPCDKDAPVAPVLDDYARAEKGARFSAGVRYDPASHEWRITPQPRILLHHASRTAWTNLVADGRRLGLARGREQDLRFTFRITDVQIEQVGGERRWLSEYFAEIESVCVP